MWDNNRSKFTLQNMWRIVIHWYKIPFDKQKSYYWCAHTCEVSLIIDNIPKNSQNSSEYKDTCNNFKAALHSLNQPNCMEMISPSAGLLTSYWECCDSVSTRSTQSDDQRQCEMLRFGLCQAYGPCSHDHCKARVVSPFYWEEVKAHRGRAPSLFLPTSSSTSAIW